MKHSDFKEAARLHQIDFKVNDSEINIPASRCPIRTITRNDKKTVVHVESSLEWKDVRDENGNYKIFFSGFREEITKEIDKPTTQASNQMVTNLLRSEHIPYNLFFPMMEDPEGTTKLFNHILGEERIDKIEKILIEHNPGGLKDGTSFDTYVEYIPLGAKPGEKGAIGIEVKYTEKEYPIKRGEKEWNETHNEDGVHLADNYRVPSSEIGWFIMDYIQDVPFSDSKSVKEHVVANQYRQIWRNHILGAAMLLNGEVTEFTSLTVYPRENGHFHDIWDKYEAKLTPEGKKTLKHITYEELFPMMRECFSDNVIPNRDKWIDYLERRYLIK